MNVSVKLFATFQKDRFQAKELNIQEGATAGDVACLLSIPHNEIGIVLINSRHALLSARLSAEDCLALFPVIGGG